MDLISSMVNAGTAPFWDTAGVIIGIAVALGVLGESIVNIIPQRVLPLVFQDAENLKRLGKWSAWLLVAALVLEVPINMAKDSISHAALGDIASAVNQEQDFHEPRRLTPSQEEGLRKPLSSTETYSNTQSDTNSIISISETQSTSPVGDRNVAVVSIGGSEVTAYADRIGEDLKTNFNVARLKIGMSNIEAEGITYYDNGHDPTALISAFRNAGISIERGTLPFNPVPSSAQQQYNDYIIVVIGQRKYR